MNPFTNAGCPNPAHPARIAALRFSTTAWLQRITTRHTHCACSGLRGHLMCLPCCSLCMEAWPLFTGDVLAAVPGSNYQGTTASAPHATAPLYPRRAHRAPFQDRITSPSLFCVKPQLQRRRPGVQRQHGKGADARRVGICQRLGVRPPMLKPVSHGMLALVGRLMNGLYSRVCNGFGGPRRRGWAQCHVDDSHAVAPTLHCKRRSVSSRCIANQIHLTTSARRRSIPLRPLT